MLSTQESKRDFQKDFQRDFALDNLKAVLILLVVVGHVIEPAVHKFEWAKSLYVFIYLFHMPMFTWAAGAVAKSDLSASNVRKILTRLVIPYFFLDFMYTVFDYFIFERQDFNYTPMVPYWILWFLFSLIFWRVLLVFLDKFRFPLVLALVLGLLVGLNSYGYHLSFSRTFVYFPFFVWGYYYKRDGHKFQWLWAKLLSLTILLCLFAVSFQWGFIQTFDLRWLYGSFGYSDFELSALEGMGVRLLLYLTAGLAGFSLLHLVKNRQYFFTKYGRDSLYIFVLHGFVIRFLSSGELYNNLEQRWSLLVVIFGSFFLLPVLSSGPAKALAGVLMNPLSMLWPDDWYLKPKNQPNHPGQSNQPKS